MQKKSHKPQWKLFRRIGIGLILLAITSTLFFYNSPQSPYHGVLQVPRNNPSLSFQSSILVTQNNQFLDIKYSCNSCKTKIGLSVTISRITSNNVSKVKTIYSSSFELVNQSTKDISLQLDPSSYIITSTLQGNYSIDLSITGFGVPYRFIIVQVFIFSIGTILCIIDIKKNDLLILKKVIKNFYTK